MTVLRESDGRKVRPNAPGTPVVEPNPALEWFARTSLVGEPIFLSPEQAAVLIPQLRETADHRRWELLAAAVMANHVHILVGVPGDPESETLLRDFKAYASRPLNRRWGKPRNGTWWTEGGSRRIKRTDAEIAAAVAYVQDQLYALAVWIDPSRARPGERGA